MGYGGGGLVMELNVRSRNDKLTDRDRPAAGGEMAAAGIHMEDGANGGS